MKTTHLMLLASLMTPAKLISAQAPTYPPLREYLMSEQAEILLAKSAAPANITDHATIEVLSPSGYRIAHQGENGFTCLVMRGWSAPTYTPQQFRDFVYDARIRAPICFNPVATRTVLPYYELRSRLAMAGKAPAQIVASRARDGKVDRTRPLCPYPQVASYKGTGSTDEAANFVCK